MKHNYITFEHAVLLKKKGFSEYTDYCIQKFTEDYVYDGDPEHPESHKAGDIRVYRMTYDPNETNTSLYPMITVAEAYEWLRNQKNPLYLFVYPVENTSCHWKGVICVQNKNCRWLTHKSFYYNNMSYDEASERLLTEALNIYKK